MELLKQDQKEFVRIIIGSAETGRAGVKAPTKTINVENTNVTEVYEMIFDAVQKREKEGMKKR